MQENNSGKENNPSIQQLLKDGKISQITVERVKIAKSIIEKKYDMKRIKEEKKRKEWENINEYLNHQTTLSLTEKEEIKQSIKKKEYELYRKNRQKLSIFQFEPKNIIGKGAFGEVRVCKYKENNKIYAVKKMKKEIMKKKHQSFNIRVERDILKSNSNWITKLNYSFQDEKYLYLVMDFCQGGDLMSYLIKEDTLSEKAAKFYIAEIILSIEEIHKMGCIHRDLKPDNILIDKYGHIKLSDFGLSIISNEILYPMTNNDNDNIEKIPNKKISDEDIKNFKNRRNNRIMAFSRVGTPDYIAPEVFGKKGYGKEIDWWSVGIILYEMLIGYPPFFSDNPQLTCHKICHFKEYFSIPDECNISKNACDLIKKFITVPDKRLGVNGIDEIKKHNFFNNFNWDNIRNMKPPFVPILNSDYDTKYFDKFEEDKNEPFYPDYINIQDKNDINNKYFGFTYNRDIENEEKENENNLIENAKKETNNKILSKSTIETSENSSMKSGDNSFYKNNKRYTKFASKSPDTTFIREKNYRKEMNIIPIQNIINQQNELINKNNNYKNNYKLDISQDNFKNLMNISNISNNDNCTERLTPISNNYNSKKIRNNNTIKSNKYNKLIPLNNRMVSSRVSNNKVFVIRKKKE